MKYNRIKKSIKQNTSIYIYLFGLTIVLMTFVNVESGINYLMLLGLATIIIYGFFHGALKTILMDGTAIILTMFVSAYIFNRDDARLVTILYSITFIWSFLCFTFALKRSSLAIDDFLDFLKFIIIAYAIVLAFQLAQSLSGMESDIFNENSDHSSKFKMNSLTMESSNTLLLVPLYMYTYIRLLELKFGKKLPIRFLFHYDKVFFFLALFLCFCSGSMTIFFSLPILFLYFLHPKHIIHLGVLVFLLCLLAYKISEWGGLNLDRIDGLINMLLSLDSLNYDKIIQQDASSATRIVPYINYIKTFDPFNTNFWFGHGIDSMDKLMNKQLYWHINENLIMLKVGNIISVPYNYGILTFIGFLYLLRKYALTKWLHFDTLFYISLFSIMTINHYITWIFFSLLFIVKFYSKKYKIKISQ